MKYSLQASEKDAAIRIDKFLSNQCGSQKVSRSYLQKLIKQGKILVNGRSVKPSYKLKIGDSIEAEITPPEKISLEPDDSIKLDIIYEDDNVIVLNKPAGLVVHPASTRVDEFNESTRGGPSPTHKKDTLVNALLAYFPDIKNVGDPLTKPGASSLRPGIVHRLDKDTSGLMIVAKNNNAFQFLKKQFQQRKVIKKYLALVSGCPPAGEAGPKKEQGIIETGIERSKKIPTKQKISFSLKAKRAITGYRIVKKFGSKYCLLEVYPKTGRMHQIRVHLAHIGHPVVGDIKYGGEKMAGLTRHFLHAFYLKLELPNKQIKEFEINLPPDLKQAIK